MGGERISGFQQQAAAADVPADSIEFAVGAG
jgi:hypothetical protein